MEVYPNLQSDPSLASPSRSGNVARGSELRRRVEWRDRLVSCNTFRGRLLAMPRKVVANTEKVQDCPIFKVGDRMTFSLPELLRPLDGLLA